MSNEFSGFTSDQCFIPNWLSLDKWGYVLAGHPKNGARQRGHRLAYRLFCGPLKQGEWVLHKCGNANCVNPYHLYIGTPQQNSDDAKRHGTTASEFRISNTKLSNEQVREIRASSLRNYELCKIFGVSKSVISNIRSGKTRKNAWTLL
ncbi:MAG: HNH endonuclease [Candidatus Accumulibacter sp.]|nr:HNH endonuclease [Accumulibacter sp.]